MGRKPRKRTCAEVAQLDARPSTYLTMIPIFRLSGQFLYICVPTSYTLSLHMSIIIVQKF